MKDRDLDQLLDAWVELGPSTAPDRVLNSTRNEVDATPQRRPWRLAWRSMLMRNATRIGAFAASAAVLAVIVILAIALRRPPGVVSGPSSSVAPSPTPAATIQRAADIRGLPPEGAVLSDSAAGELVLSMEENVTSSGTLLRLYADGRLIWNRYRYVFPGDGPFIGLVEQRVAPSGVAYLTSLAIDTGLFDSDLALARDTGFLDLALRNGDQLTRITWGPITNPIVGQTAPAATNEQALAITELTRRLNDQTTWPADAWDDMAVRAYLPSQFAICFRGVPDPMDQAQVMRLLPQPAQELLRDGETARDSNCVDLSTDHARTLARALADAGIERDGPDGVLWLRYVIQNQPTTGNKAWISFGPVLPDGEGTWLGPG